MYSWEPFTVDGAHLTFAQHVEARLQRNRSSHWGPAVYKWEGPVTSGPNAGTIGLLIGETDDLRQRIKQYVSGTQERGNKLWRERFLSKGEVGLHILRLRSFSISDGDRSASVEVVTALSSPAVASYIAGRFSRPRVAPRGPGARSLASLVRRSLTANTAFGSWHSHYVRLSR